ncbi:isochorismatase family protein [Roseomonas sp. BN140053]|uniref:isochorismatase family protein n=1 Tax=Roseomonas sp. BN140053 TaxID=3391898 RepID=UPI0039EA7961
MTPHPELDPAILRAAAERRGRPHVYDHFEPARTALVVIDLQNAFVAEGAPCEVPAARGVVSAVNRLAAALRAAGGTVAWVQATFEHGGWPLFFEHMVQPATAATILAALQSGAPMHALWPELEVAPEDVVVPKYRFSAFLPGASTLPAILRGRGIDTVLVAGCMTNMCCDSSARDAVMTDFRTVMVSDANAARTDTAHLAALSAFLQGFGDVRTVDSLIAALRA